MPKIPLVDEYKNAQLAPNIAALTRFNKTFGDVTPTILYEGSNPEPHTINHERIHAYQQNLETFFGVQRPTEAELKANILKEFYYKPKYGKDGDESPAYSLSEVRPFQQLDFNRYVDENYKRSKGLSSPIETLLPAEAHRNYVQNHPRPLLPPDTIGDTFGQIPSMLDILKNAWTKK